MATHRGHEYAELIRAAEAQGWRVVLSAGTGHYRWYAPDGKTILGDSGSPSDHRAIKNHKARLRRAGLKL